MTLRREGRTSSVLALHCAWSRRGLSPSPQQAAAARLRAMAEHVASVASVAPPVAPGEPHSPPQPVRRVSVPTLDLPAAETRSEGGINSPRAGAVPKSRSEALLSQLNDPESPPSASPGRAADSGASSGPPSGEVDASPDDVVGAGKGSEAAPVLAGAASRLALPSFPSLLSFATAGAAPEAPEETDAERTARRLQARGLPARALHRVAPR